MYANAWWPLSVEADGVPDFTVNHLQLNSIASAATLADSWFTASGAAPGRHRPGAPDYPVDGLGVVFDGATRTPRIRGLTRPHSARLHDGGLWLDNSGYGELRRADIQATSEEIDAEVVAALPGWTRGLAIIDRVAFVGTSRVIPGFAQYAPGLDVATSICGIHAVDTTSGATLASLVWPAGNQIFAIEALPATFSPGLPGQLTPQGPVPVGPDFYYSALPEETT